MTKSQAEEILKHPKFGDSECIAARERLEQEPEIERYRKLVVGKELLCWQCGGHPQNDKCDICNSTGMERITTDLAAKWDLDILQGVAVELGLEH